MGGLFTVLAVIAAGAGADRLCQRHQHHVSWVTTWRSGQAMIPRETSAWRSRAESTFTPWVCSWRTIHMGSPYQGPWIQNLFRGCRSSTML